MTMFRAVVAEDVCKGGCVMEVDNIVEEMKELAVQLSEFAKELAEYERLRGKVVVSWDELYRLADGCGIGDPELKAKDNARAQITQMAFEEGFNLECMESPEEGVDSFLECYPQYDRFDLDGNMRR